MYPRLMKTFCQLNSNDWNTDSQNDMNKPKIKLQKELLLRFVFFLTAI